jgi:hypothetical protein
MDDVKATTGIEFLFQYVRTLSEVTRREDICAAVGTPVRRVTFDRVV